MRVKICGITNLGDAQACVDNDVDAIGFVFYPRSPRAVSPAKASEISKALPPFVTRVGLFVNASADEIRETYRVAQLDLVQLHGDEPADFCEGLELPYMKAIRVRSRDQIETAMRDYKSARALLLDTYVEGVRGGTGKTFDWSIIPAKRTKPIVLAGGLNAGNVAEAISNVRPDAIDTSGGVEGNSKGIKDVEMIRQFVKEVKGE